MPKASAHRIPAALNELGFIAYEGDGADDRRGDRE
ncbi:hypothetical protein [Actinomadura sp. NBRC 104412]